MAGSRPRVFTIPPGAAFLEVLAESLIEGRLIPGFRPADDPLLLADATIYLPTRRACRALEAVFVARAAHGVAVLPRIAPLGDVDEDEEAFAEDIPSPSLPPPLSLLERQLTLSRLVAAWATNVRAEMLRAAPGEEPLLPTTPAEALSLAGELGKLIDSVETEEVDWSAFSGLVPADYDEAWRLTANFLAIAIAHWPDHLKELGRSDPAWRRSRALRAVAEDKRQNPPRGPVIAAGSTGSIPATAALLASIASLPNGAVVLPGLDTLLDEPSWRMLEEDDAASFTSPQGGLKRLTAALGVERKDVVPLAEPPVPERVALISTALRPAASTDRWLEAHLVQDQGGGGLNGMAMAEASNEREEALVVAAAAREALETKGRSVAIVTPDRDLARRVTAELCRWGIEVEDSAGCPLSTTPAGLFARLIAEVAATDFAPIALLGLIQHRTAAFGLDPATMRRAATALELGALRGIMPPPGIAGLREALARARRDRRSHHRRRMSDADWDAAGDLVARLERALAPLADLRAQSLSLGSLAQAHAEAIRIAGATPEDADAAFADRDGAALLALLESVAASGNEVALRLEDYPSAILTLIGGAVARPFRPSHARITILGLLEARLITADRLILAGLDEGIWPPQTRNDPWLSRPMRRQIGLPPPERRIGLAAHDFAQAFAHPDVIVTRALKREGVPSTPARWLQRIAAVAGDQVWGEARARGDAYVLLARTLDEAPREAAPAAPQPKPALPLRPARLSITEIETFVRDPYSIYAKHVLKLQPLDPPGLAPGAADRGTIIHDVLARFVAEGADPRMPHAHERLLALGAEAFATLEQNDLTAIWWRRFLRIADWFLGWEAGRRPSLAESHVEQEGRSEWTTVAGRRFALIGRADRIDRFTDGTLAIVDYKTGNPPGAREARVGLAPQLPLEAAMVAGGGFDAVRPSEASSLLYVRLSGGTPPGELREVSDPTKEGASAPALAEESMLRLRELIDRFEAEDQPYTSLDHPKFKRRPNGPYDHLARVREWSIAGDEGGEG
ncbi:double-strand break repair protein AddB [Agaricicola taiwanensis]|uniref:Double-strand break repair protein AddB n=1 Tax=Agaricicola taiwanensis TaxID=591372 RepID=A0A8J2YG01_9RHOB|nr:double-strand break repair protein AddB [Agaricicola taiwanensis]GGE32690.1 double-strand break repair protein AddB [Agaricicola taiwanensis]